MQYPSVGNNCCLPPNVCIKHDGIRLVHNRFQDGWTKKKLLAKRIKRENTQMDRIYKFIHTKTQTRAYTHIFLGNLDAWRLKLFSLITRESSLCVSVLNSHSNSANIQRRAYRIEQLHKHNIKPMNTNRTREPKAEQERSETMTKEYQLECAVSRTPTAQPRICFVFISRLPLTIQLSETLWNFKL